MLVTISVFSREEVYSFDEALSIIGVGKDALTRARASDILTSVRIKDGESKAKYFLKTEIDAIAGLESVLSKEVRTRIAAVRKEVALAATVVTTRDYIAEENSYGDPIERFALHAREAYSHDSKAFWDTLKDLLGVSKILTEA
jgi:hypothetical protein